MENVDYIKKCYLQKRTEQAVSGKYAMDFWSAGEAPEDSVVPIAICNGVGLLGQQYLYWGQKELKQVDQECQRDALLTQWR